MFLFKGSTMAKYRQISLEVEAVQYTGTDKSRQECLELAGITLDYGSWCLAGDSLRIVREGRSRSYLLRKNSWLVKDEEGFFYVEEADDFEKTHQQIKE
jgi:hypothetical protein